MKPATLIAALSLALAAGCALPTGERVVVHRVGPDDLLKLRGGPGLEFRILAGLPDGTVLNRGACVTELGQRWCRVSLAGAPGLTGYVAADYLSEL